MFSHNPGPTYYLAKVNNLTYSLDFFLHSETMQSSRQAPAATAAASASSRPFTLDWAKSVGLSPASIKPHGLEGRSDLLIPGSDVYHATKTVNALVEEVLYPPVPQKDVPKAEYTELCRKRTKDMTYLKDRLKRRMGINKAHNLVHFEQGWKTVNGTKGFTNQMVHVLHGLATARTEGEDRRSIRGEDVQSCSPDNLPHAAYISIEEPKRRYVTFSDALGHMEEGDATSDKLVARCKGKFVEHFDKICQGSWRGLDELVDTAEPPEVLTDWSNDSILGLLKKAWDESEHVPVTPHASDPAHPPCSCCTLTVHALAWRVLHTCVTDDSKCALNSLIVLLYERSVTNL